jgi:radical SAM additional 4Fe4S-binding domain
MNDTMLAFIKETDIANTFEEFSDDDRKSLNDVVEQMHKLGILVEPGYFNRDDKPAIPSGSTSMSHLTIFVTTKCNLRCSYCYAHGGDSEKTISRDYWSPAMDYFFSNLSSHLTDVDAIGKSVNLSIHGGGEPTTEFAILKEIVADFNERAYAAGLNPVVGMGSNGTYDESVFQWIIENKINVNISMDGPRDIQNHQRPYQFGAQSYDDVVRNLQSLVREGRRTSIRATITNKALETMEETVRLAKQLGLAIVHFEPVALTGRCANSSITRPDAEQFADKFLQCFVWGLKNNVEVRYSGLRCFENCHQQFCSANGDSFCVTPDGNITTCYEVLDLDDPAANEFFIGKVDPIQGQVVLDQARIEKLKLRIADNMEACSSCFLKYNCAGDCPVKSFRYSNQDLYTPDPYRCHIADRINKQLIAWLADGVIELPNVGQVSTILLN